MPPWIGQGMGSGVRDAGNLCWKLAAVVGGQADEGILDSYATERQPQVRAFTRRAVVVGRVITERRRTLAAGAERALLARRAAAETRTLDLQGQLVGGHAHPDGAARGRSPPSGG